MKKYGWVITNDIIDGGKRNGINGPDATPTAEEIKADPNAHPFRLLDADGNVYAEGLFMGDHESEDAFSPLDDFGTAAWGCTDIQYKYGDEWETL